MNLFINLFYNNRNDYVKRLEFEFNILGKKILKQHRL